MEIITGTWTPDTERLIKSALSTATIDDIKMQVEQGAQLFALTDGDETIGAFVLRIDHFATINEGVLVAAGGMANGIDLTQAILPVIEKMFIGCQSIRIHTGRVGLAKKLCLQGYKMAELILSKEINNG